MKLKVLAMAAVMAFSVSTLSFAHEGFNVDEKVAHWKDALGLSDDQAKAIKPILQDYKDSTELAEHQKKYRLEVVLTGDQMKKLEDMEHEHKKMEHDQH